MIKYNPVVIDGNIFLMSHAAAILGNMPAKDIIYNSTHENPMYRGRGIIIKSFLAMVLKSINDMIKGGLAPTSVSIVWDERNKGKYHKSILIDTLESTEGYKGDRSYLTKDDLDKMTLELNDCVDPDLILELKKKRDEAEKSIIINKERYIAREFIKDNLPKFGIPSFSLSGWEADDLDFIFAIETEKLGGYHIHCSGDSDWSFNLRERDVFWQINRSELYRKSYQDVKKKFGIRDDLDIIDWAEIFYSAKGNHNFLRKTLNPNIKRVTKAILDKVFSGDYSDITDMKRFEVQRKCFRVTEFPEVEKVRDLHKEIIRFNIAGSDQEFKDMLDTLSMRDDQKFFMSKNYQDFTASIRKSILDQV